MNPNIVKLDAAIEKLVEQKKRITADALVQRVRNALYALDVYGEAQGSDGLRFDDFDEHAHVLAIDAVDALSRTLDYLIAQKPKDLP